MVLGPADAVTGADFGDWGYCIWTGAAGNTRWSDAVNWSNNQVPFPGASLAFMGNLSCNDLSGAAFHSIVFAAGTTWILGTPGNQTRLSGGISQHDHRHGRQRTQLSTSAWMPRRPFQQQSHLHPDDQRFVEQQREHDRASMAPGPINLGSSASVISGGGGIVKQGSGTATVSGNNTYGGGTTVSAGTLVFANATALPPGTNVTVGSSAVVVFCSGYTGPITASGPVAGAAGEQSNALAPTQITSTVVTTPAIDAVVSTLSAGANVDTGAGRQGAVDEAIAALAADSVTGGATRA